MTIKYHENHDENCSSSSDASNDQKILVVNSRGVYQNDERTYTVILVAVAQDGALMQDAHEGPGRNMGFEIFDEIDFSSPKKVTSAMTYLYVDPMEPQEMPVVIHNGFGSYFP